MTKGHMGSQANKSWEHLHLLTEWVKEGMVTGTIAGMWRESCVREP